MPWHVTQWVEQPDPTADTPLESYALRRVAGRLEAQVKNTTRLTNQLHNLMAGAFPELATLIKDLSTGWVLRLLKKYPHLATYRGCTRHLPEEHPVSQGTNGRKDPCCRAAERWHAAG